MIQMQWMMQDFLIWSGMNQDALLIIPMIFVALAIVISFEQDWKRPVFLVWGCLALIPLTIMVVGVASFWIEVPRDQYCRAYQILDQYGKQALETAIVDNHGRFTFSCISVAREKSVPLRDKAEAEAKAAVALEQMKKCSTPK